MFCDCCGTATDALFFRGMQCRFRKRKCGGTLPSACPNCVEDDLTCDWPAGDGRSSRARQPQASPKGMPIFAGQITSGGQQDTESESWKMPSDWLEGLDGMISGWYGKGRHELSRLPLVLSRFLLRSFIALSGHNRRSTLPP